jgi:hypothetical protein
MISGRMHLRYRDPQSRENPVWSAPLTANTWHHYVIALHLSKDASVGYIEFWFDGVQQSLTGGQTRYYARTYDSGNHNCPKWGIYGGQGTEMTNYIDDLKVGTDYASVSRDGSLPILKRLSLRMSGIPSGTFDLTGRRVVQPDRTAFHR